MRIMIACLLLLAGCAAITPHVRYRDGVGAPDGYKAMCKREPAVPECGGGK